MTDSPDISARPKMYIDVVMNNQKQIFDVDSARKLHEELGLALAALDGPTLVPDIDDSDRQTNVETPAPTG